MERMFYVLWRAWDDNTNKQRIVAFTGKLIYQRSYSHDDMMEPINL